MNDQNKQQQALSCWTMTADIDSPNLVLLERIASKSPSVGLRRLWKLIEFSNTLDDTEGDLLRAALMDLIKQTEGSKKHLETLLGLTACEKGERSPAYQLKKLMRDFYLYRCAEVIRAEHGTRSWITAELLLLEINSFQTRKLDKIREGRRPIKNEIEGYLNEVFLLVEKVPQDTGYIHGIICELDGVSGSPSSK